METNPLVSIITQTYNDGIFLQEAIESALKQTYKNTEIILTNDGSTDEFTLKYLKELNNPKIKVINKKNEGLARARNTGISESKGEFFVTLDADDKLDPMYIEKTLAVMNEDSKNGVIYTDQQFFGIENKVMRMKDFDPVYILVENHVSVCSLIRRETFDQVKKKNKIGYNPNMQYGGEDWDFWINISELGWNLKALHEPLFHYRKREGSMISNTLKQYREVIRQLVENHSANYKKNFAYVIIELEMLYKDRQLSLVDITNNLNDSDWLIKKFFKKLVKKQ